MAGAIGFSLAGMLLAFFGWAVTGSGAEKDETATCVVGLGIVFLGVLAAFVGGLSL